MRELNTSEINQVSGAGYILDKSKYVGYRIGKLFGNGSLGERIGKGMGSFLEAIPGAGLINGIIAQICPPPAEDPLPWLPIPEGEGEAEAS